MKVSEEDANFDSLIDKITLLIEQSRVKVLSTINAAEVYTKYYIGSYIIEYEQKGSKRADYGKYMLVSLSSKLIEKFGSGWSVENLKLFRRFYIVYSNSVINDYPIENDGRFVLSWTHYVVLMRITNSDVRNFYEIECHKQNWSVRQLQRQYNSSLYERLALSRNKEDVMRLANEGQTIEKASDLIKNPLTLEFLGLKVDESYSETKLEESIISKMKDFLLEMGKGFLFEARQKRFIFEEDVFYVDLVLYNRLLQCYCLIDLKTNKLTHQDLGQMQMYVNYFDRYVKRDFEKPTIGILLCREKKDALVQLTLPRDANIYAAEYSLYLPDKAILQSKLQEWITEFAEIN